MSLSHRAVDLTELMDDPDADPVRLRRTISRFRAVNAVISGWGGVYRRLVRPALTAAPGPSRILDIGCGGGDVLRRVVGWARADGLDVDGLGIDPDERVLAVARERSDVPGVSYRRALSGELAAEGQRFDVVISNHLLHHLDRAELGDVLADTAAIATRLGVHSDIRRGRLPYAAYAVGITPLAPGSLLRTDGLRSIRRSYTSSELAAALPPGWTTATARPFRVLAVHRPRGDDPGAAT